MIDTHHGATAEADQGDGRGKGPVIRPEIKDADLGLGGSGGGVDDGLEKDAFLEEVIAAACGRDGGELVVGGGKLNALAGERI